MPGLREVEGKAGLRMPHDVGFERQLVFIFFVVMGMSLCFSKNR